MLRDENTKYAIRNTNFENTLQKLSHKKKHVVRSAFTACTVGISLLETVTDAAEIAARVARFLLSTARSSFEELQNARKCGQKLYGFVESISWGESRVYPNRSGEIAACWNQEMLNAGNSIFSFRAFLREKHEAKHSITQTSLEKGRQPRQTNE